MLIKFFITFSAEFSLKSAGKVYSSLFNNVTVFIPQVWTKTDIFWPPSKNNAKHLWFCQSKTLLFYTYSKKVLIIYNVWGGWPVYEVKCSCSRGQEWKKEGCHSHQLFNICFLWYEELVIWIWSSYLWWLQNATTLNSEVFNFKWLKNDHP